MKSNKKPTKKKGASKKSALGSRTPKLAPKLAPKVAAKPPKKTASKTALKAAPKTAPKVTSKALVPKKQERLGRGLSALFSESTLTEKDKLVNKGAQVLELEISKIHPNPNQPRKYLGKDSLEELATSIKQVGLIQPIIVRENDKGSYELIAGERRFRATQLLKQKRIMAFIESRGDEQLLEKMLIENIQREDLSPFEEAVAYKTLMETRELRQEEIAELVGKSRSHIANIIRLSKLPLAIQNLLHEGKIPFGIARALINVDEKDIKPLLKRIVAEQMTVRDVEKEVATLQKPNSSKKSEPSVTRRASEHQYLLEEVESQFREKLGTKVRILDLKKNVGKIEIEYYNYDHLEDLSKKIK